MIHLPPPRPASEVTPDEIPITSTEMEHDVNPVQPPPDQQLSTETTPPAIDARIYLLFNSTCMRTSVFGFQSLVNSFVKIGSFFCTGRMRL